MATPTIKIDQATLGAGVAGESRDDGVTGQLVTLTDPANAAGSYSWELFEKPPGSTAALSGAATATATFTPDIAGTYLVRLTFDGVDSSGYNDDLNRFFSVQGGLGVKFTNGFRAKGAGETLQFDDEDGWASSEYTEKAAVDARLPSTDQKTDLGTLDGAAQGTVFYSDSSGRVATLAPGTSGEVLQTQGAGSDPQWATGGVGVHDLGGADHNADTLANLNSKVSDATLIDTADSRLSDARTPTAHNLGGAEHSADTLANLNTKVSDATLIDTADSRLSDARTPTSHASTHENGNADEISVAGLSGVLADDQVADTVKTTTGPTSMVVGAVADGEFLKRDGSTLVGDTPPGSTTAEALGTTGSDVDVGSAAPPTTGQVLKATGATTATWQDESGGGGAAGAAGAGTGPWEFVDSHEVTGSAVQELEFTGLDGDVDERYMLVYDIFYGGNPTAVQYDIQPNGSAISSGITERLISANGTEQAAEYANEWVLAITQGDRIVGSTEVAVSTGARRYSTGKDAMVSSAFTDGIVDVYAGVWHDTTTNITSMKLRADAASGFAVGTKVYLYKIRKNAGNAVSAGALEYLDHITLSATATTVSFGADGDGVTQRALDGDVDEEYEIQFYIVRGAGAGGVTFVDLQPNGISSNQESTRYNSTNGGSVAAASEAVLHLANFSTGYANGAVSHGQATFYAKSGNFRHLDSFSSEVDGTIDTGINRYGGGWTDTSTRVTSLDIVAGTTDALGVGTVVTLYRRSKNNVRADSADSYERQLTPAVDEGASTQTFTLGKPNYAGSAVAVSVFANDATDAGTINVNLKVAGTTVLTATLDTTNTTHDRALANIGTHPFAYDDEVTVEVVADSSYSNTGSVTTGLTVNVTLTNDGLFVQPANGVVGETVLDAVSDTISVTGLDGDAHGEYIVDVHLLLADSNTHIITAEPNGVNTNLLGRSGYDYGNFSAETTWQVAEVGVVPGRQIFGRMVLSAGRTQGGVSKRRTLKSELAADYTQSSWANWYHFAGHWTSTADNLISIDIVDSIASGFLAGSRVTIRKA